MPRATGLLPSDPVYPAARSGFATWQNPGKDLFPFGGSSAFVDLLDRVHLRTSEAGWAVLARTQQRCRIEMALARVVENTVFDSIQGVAGLIYGVRKHRDLGRRYVARGVIL